jgi:choline-sulfatase
MEPKNLLFIMSDEHTRKALGCYGSEIVQTPNLDCLAATGTRFSSAYSNSPLCVPSRASLATGRYVHDIRCWDNGHPWDGTQPGWGHRLKQTDHRSVSIGKLHFRSTEDDNGFDEEIWPMHVRFGVGDLIGLLRKNKTTYPSTKTAAKEGEQVIHGPAMMAEAAGVGETNHSDYDLRITDAACDWLRNRKRHKGEKPWLVYVSFVSPHFPLIAPLEFYDLYPHDKIPMPIQYGPEERPTHPTIVANREIWNYDDYFDEAKVRRARAGYYGLCSFLDHNIGRVLGALEESGEAENTRIIYTSDHGDHLGDRGIWSCSTLYEESIGVPMIMAGPDVPAGKTVDEIVSLVDLYPTILEALGEDTPKGETDRPGTSLLQIANGATPKRTVLSEYHAGGSITGSFMVRNGRWKYMHHVGYAPQLFDLEADPLELIDLGENPDHTEVRAECERLLRQVVDPDAANAQAFSDQEEKIEFHGGVEAVIKRGHFAEHAMDRNLGVE